MTNLQLIKSAAFGDIQCDIYGGDNEFYMTREQIGEALEYSDPATAIKNIHQRHTDRLDGFSVRLKLSATDGKSYNTTVYTRKGVMEICRHSQQPKADAFMDWVWEIMDGLITGRTALIPQTFPEALRLAADLAEKNQELLVDIERKEQIIGELQPKADYVDHILSSMGAMTAAQIAADYGMTANKLNRILKEEKIQRYVGGQWVLYKEHMGLGYTKSETIPITRSDGRLDTKLFTKWTQKGRLMINEVLNRRGIYANMDLIGYGKHPA